MSATEEFMLSKRAKRSVDSVRKRYEQAHKVGNGAAAGKTLTSAIRASERARDEGREYAQICEQIHEQVCSEMGKAEFIAESMRAARLVLWCAAGVLLVFLAINFLLFM